MKKYFKFIIPVLIVAVTVFGGVMLTSALTSLTVTTAEGVVPKHGVFSMTRGQTLDFNVLKDGTEIISGAGFTVAFSSSDPNTLYVDEATGVAVADRDGLMPGTSGTVTLSVSVTENSTGKKSERSYTVFVDHGTRELFTTISGINEGMPLETGTEYTLISRTYDYAGDELSLSSYQLFCTYTCDRCEIVSGRFIPEEPGVYRIITIGYPTEEELLSGTGEAARDVLEVYVQTKGQGQ